MRRVGFASYGGPEVLRLHEADRPEPGADELLVEVHLAGVTLPVVRLTRGNGDGTGVALPYTPGGEVVGTVVALGPEVTGWTVGQRVTGLAFAGSYAEFAVLATRFAVAVPDGVSDAAALLVARSGQVALGAVRAGGFQPGEDVLVTSAAGGVGHLAVQLARALGAGRVVGAVGSMAKAEFVRELGVDAVVEYAGDWGEPVDVVLDAVGGAVQRQGLAALRPFGRLVCLNGIGDPVDSNALRMASTAVIGFNMRHFATLRAEKYQAQQEELWRLVLAGTLVPRLHARLPLAQAARAHRIIEDRANLGKVALDPRQ